MRDAAIPRRQLRPSVVLAGVALLLLALLVGRAILLSDDDDGVVLSSYSAKPGGARGLYEVFGRLGWTVARRTEPFRGRLDTSVVWVSLAPALPATSAEVHQLLESVRAGAGLLVAVDAGSPLADSLGLAVRRGMRHTVMVLADVEDWEDEYDSDEAAEEGSAAAADTTARDDAAPPATGAARSALVDSVLAAAAEAEDPDPGFRRYGARYFGEVTGWLVPRDPWPADTTVFLAVSRLADSLRVPLPVAIGFPFGRGRVVAVAEPGILVNDFVRAKGGILPVRMLEWLAPPGERALVFDEFHQGYGSHASLGRAVRRFLGETPAGRTIVVLLLAAALLVLALGARPFAPAAAERIERRSPLEHVGALSRAYEEVGASRLAARRLARGVRRRRSALGRGGSDADFLAALADRHPALAGDVRLVLEAMQRPLPPEKFVRLAPALDRIERTIAT